jgi:hypothetical protein
MVQRSPYFVQLAAGGTAWLSPAEATAALRDGTAVALMLAGEWLAAEATLRRLLPRVIGSINGTPPEFGHHRGTR